VRGIFRNVIGTSEEQEECGEIQEECERNRMNVRRTGGMTRNVRGTGGI